MNFEVIDVSGDIGIRASGRTLKEAFINTALGMFSLITNLNKVEDKKEITIALESHSIEGVLISLLNELIFEFDAYGFIGKEIDINELAYSRITAVIRGEEFDPERHERRLLLKAATYHALRIENEDGLWQVDVIFDI